MAKKKCPKKDPFEHFAEKRDFLIKKKHKRDQKSKLGLSKRLGSPKKKPSWKQWLPLVWSFVMLSSCLNLLQRPIPVTALVIQFLRLFKAVDSGKFTTKRVADNLAFIPV